MGPYHPWKPVGPCAALDHSGPLFSAPSCALRNIHHPDFELEPPCRVFRALEPRTCFLFWNRWLFLGIIGFKTWSFPVDRASFGWDHRLSLWGPPWNTFLPLERSLFSHHNHRF